jgi:CobQ-like glutamine amidotransferase family enzyme
VTAILQFFPEMLNVNGDAQNALVLAQRATWAGIQVDLVAVRVGDSPPRTAPALIVIGSSVDSQVAGTRVALEPFASPLRDWAAAGIPVLGIGTGLEILGEDGLGLLPGRAVPRENRATGDLAVDSEVGRLVGFENHARGYQLPAAAGALGTVVRGTGNDGRSEGARSGTVWGTHLHGPVLAKNPVLGDALLVAAFGDSYQPENEHIRFVDSLALAGRRAVLARLGIADS